MHIFDAAIATNLHLRPAHRGARPLETERSAPRRLSLAVAAIGLMVAALDVLSLDASTRATGQSGVADEVGAMPVTSR